MKSKYFVIALKSALIVSAYFIFIFGACYLMYDPSFAEICAKTNEKGSSAWVSCVDRMLKEQKQ